MKELSYRSPNDLIQRRTNLMILDFDVLRFHSFDFFRYLLLDKSYFMQIDPMFLPMLRNHLPIAEQVDFYRSTCSNINPFDNFRHTAGSVKFNEIDQYINAMLKNPNAKSVMTQLSVSLYTSLCSSMMTTHVIRYRSDTTKPTCISDAKNIIIANVDEMFRPKDIAEYIVSNRINALMISSIDLAILVSAELLRLQYREPMTIMVCNYRYNYISINVQKESMLVLNHPQEITSLIDNYQYEFCTIDPFTGITYNKRILQNSEKKGT